MNRRRTFVIVIIAVFAMTLVFFTMTAGATSLKQGGEESLPADDTIIGVFHIGDEDEFWSIQPFSTYGIFRIGSITGKQFYFTHSHPSQIFVL